MITYSTECGRCGWAIAPGDAICAKCGTRSGSSESDAHLPAWPGEQSIAAAFEAELLARLRQAVLGEYHIIGELGRGGMCIVYLAHDLTLDRRVAIKVLLPSHVTGHGVAEQRLRQEARTAASLVHPNIIPVYAVRHAEGLVYLVMQYVEGRTLDVVLKQVGRLPWEAVQTTLVQVGGALEYAHQRRVIHRDIKPGNIIIGNNGVVVLADFGIAKVTDAPDITGAGASIGTPCYMSPEQCSGGPATPAADQYALGVVAYEMLTGKPPFLGDSIASVITQHLFEKPRPIENVAPECPNDLRRTIYRMLEKSPERRWASIKDALRSFGGAGLAETEPGQMLMAGILERMAVTPAPEEGVSTPGRPAPRRVESRGRRAVSDPRHAHKVTLGVVLAAAAVLILFERMRPVSEVASAATADIQLIEAIISPPPAEDTDRDSRERSGPAPSFRSTPRTDSVPRSETAATVDDSVARPARPTVSPTGAERQAPEIPSPPVVASRTPAAAGQPGNVLIGTRGLPAVLYVDGQARGVIDRLDSWSMPSGSVRLSIQQDGCVSWDSTVTVEPGETSRIGYRSPECSP